MSTGANKNDRLSTIEVEGLSSEERTINRWAEFANPEVEAAYRTSTLARDRSLTLFAMVLSGLIAASFAFSDLSMFGTEPTFWRLLSIRGALLLMTIVAALVIRSGSARKYDGWTTAWAIVTLFVVVIISYSRSEDYLTHFAFDSMVLLAMYVVFITRYRWQLLLGLSFTAALIIVALGKNADAIAQWAVIASVLSVNLFGMLLSWRFHNLGRQQFFTMQAERELRLALEQLAFTDSLTGISNRRDFMARADGEFERFRRHRRTFSLLVLDLDHFKQVNDRFGHEAGDDVLRRFGEMLIEQARTNDLPARMGGEEFAVLLPETSIDEAEEVASRMLQSTRKLTADPAGKVNVTVSIGLTQVRLFDESIDDVISRADRALYQAKEKGRDRAISALA